MSKHDVCSICGEQRHRHIGKGNWCPPKTRFQEISEPHFYVDGDDGCGLCGEGICHYIHLDPDA